MSGTLYIVGTPIGNLEDITLRALRILKEVKLIACEDTRQTQKLLNHYSIKTPTVSYHNYNEEKRAPELIEKIMNGLDIALVSDAGMPGISDPGYRVIHLAIQKDIPVIPIPGPSSILTALVISGLPTHGFVFEGFLPEKTVLRKKRLLQLIQEERTMIFFESARRVPSSLKDFLDVFGDRQIALVRELTKKFESAYRSSIKEILDAQDKIPLKGEFVLVVSGKTSQETFDNLSIEEHVNQMTKLMNISRKEAIKLVADLRGLSKRDVYQRFIEL